MIYFPPSLQGFVNQHSRFSAWTDHAPFAYDLVAAQAPACVVELGTHGGLSYFTFCQSVKQHGLASRCFAVDTWEGDAHAGYYDEDVYRDVASHNDQHYREFSTLLRMRFDAAEPRFEEGSVALLHIDGFHSYEAAQRDFEAWFSKVEPGGIVLFHDVLARLPDFGVWRFWDEISSQHSSFTFRHGYGLGVLRKAGGAPPDAPLLQLLFSGDEATESRLRAFYVHASRHVDYLRQRNLTEKVKEKMRRKQQAASSE